MNAVTSTTTERLPANSRRSHRGMLTTWIAGSLFIVGLAGAFVLGAIPRWQRQQSLQIAAATPTRPTVNVVRPRRAPENVEQILPGNAQPYLQAAIYARTNGYLKRRLVDIGDRVQEGQLLAEISAPEIDAQLEQARAAVTQSKANLVRAQADEVFAKQEEVRYEKVYKARAGTREDYENKIALSKVATANVGATQATIDENEATAQRLETLQSFQKLKAPFNGVITVRNVDPGALITADNPSTEQLLFRIAATDPLRIFVDVPQVYATAIKVGQQAVVTRREQPGRVFLGKVTRTANEIDSNTRTLHTEVQVPNPHDELLPGMYLQVKFLIDRETDALLIPGAAVVTRSQGPTLAVLAEGNVVRYRPVELGRDHGAEIEILNGVKEDDRVIVHPGDDLPEGAIVDILSTVSPP